MSVKPWQKATLSVMGGAAVYVGFLDVLTAETQHHNQAAVAQQEKLVAQEKSLTMLFTAKKKTLLSLESKLKAEEESTAKVDAQIKTVNAEISQIRAGHIPGSFTLPSVPVTSIPKTTSATNIQPPPVQTVTTASGV